MLTYFLPTHTVQEVSQSLCQSLYEFTRTIVLQTFSQDFTNQCDGEGFFIRFLIMKLAINNFGEFIDKGCIVEDDDIGNLLNRLSVIYEGVDEIEHLIHVTMIINANNCPIKMRWAKVKRNV